jgi:hypothetical protein
MKSLRTCVFACLICFTTSSFSLEGWKVTDNTNLRAYQPNDIESGKVFTYFAMGPFDLNGSDLKNWFSNRTLQMQRSFGGPLRKWVLTPNKEGWSSVNAYVDKKSGLRMSVAYQGGMLDSDRAYILTLISSLDISLVKKYRSAFNTVLSDAKQYLSGKPSIADGTAITQQVEIKPKKQQKTAKTEPKKTREIIRVAPGKGADINDIALFWIHRYWNVLKGTYSIHTHLLFEDGTAYKDCTIPPDELDVKASKKLEPKKWTTWRKQWSTYQFKDQKKSTWYDLEGVPGIKAPDNTVISGDFFNAGGTPNSRSWMKHIIFYDDGRFEISSSAMQSNTSLGGGGSTPLITSAASSDKHGSESATVVSGHSNSDDTGSVSGGVTSQRKDGSKNRGRYEIKDYTITMMHDNGYTHTELFLYEKQSEVTTFVYGKDLYWLED